MVSIYPISTVIKSYNHSTNDLIAGPAAAPAPSPPADHRGHVGAEQPGGGGSGGRGHGGDAEDQDENAGRNKGTPYSDVHIYAKEIL